MHFYRLLAFVFFGTALLMPLAGNAQLTANFAANQTSGCGNTLILLNDQSTGNPTGWAWQVINANNVVVFTSNLQNPTFLLVPGTYTVCLTVTGAGGVTNQLCRNAYLRINAIPQAAISAVPTIGCSPMTVQFTDASTPGTCAIDTWSWNFGDGNGSSLQNPVHQYVSANPTTFTPTLIVTDSCGCTSTIAVPSLIRITNPPNAAFTFTPPVAACNPPISVNFTNQSSAPSGNMSFVWDFGDGTPTQTQVNPNHNFTTSGTYIVTLTVTDVVSNCTDVITQPITINVVTSAINFMISDTNVCIGENVSFTDLTVGGNVGNWNWDFGDGNTDTQQNPSHGYTTPGCYTPVLSVTVDGCSGSYTFPSCITVSNNATISPTFVVTPSCAPPVQVNFQANANGAVTWNFGDPGAGANNTSNLPNPVHFFNSFGTFNVTVTSTLGNCTSTGSLTITLSPATAAFTVDPALGCTPLTVNFTDASQTVNPVVDWAWTVVNPALGVSQTSNVQNPSLIFPDTGCYDVTLAIEDAGGCVDTFTQTSVFCVGMQFVPNFIGDPVNVCAQDTVQFTNLTPLGYSSVLWDFGDGATSTEIDPQHEFGDLDSFTVSLMVRHYGCDSTVERINYIYVLGPIATFDVDHSCDPDSLYIVNFINNSERANRWRWDFGTGNIADTSLLENPTFDYTPYGRGVYTVTLIAYNDTTGCEYEYTNTVTIAEPIAYFEVLQDTGCAPFQVPLLVNCQDAAQYQWTATGATVTGGATANPSITYNTHGYKFPIRLIITDVNGCKDTTSYTDTIFVSRVFPDYTFTDNIGCTPLTPTFTDISTTFLGTNVSWSWNFNNGQPNGNGQVVSTVYNTPGNYNVALTVTNSLGCTRTITKPSIIQATYPFPSFVYDTLVCAGQPVTFNNTSVGAALNYHWDFGTGNPADTSNLQTPTFAFPADGYYTICLYALDSNGCDSTYCNTIHVASPVAAFNATDTLAICPPLLVNFLDLSANAISWFWDFGDSTGFSTLQYPFHNYTYPGNFTVTLIIQSFSGCYDTLVVPDFVTVEGPTGDFTFQPDSGCAPLTVTFNVNYTSADTLTLVAGDGGAVTVGLGPPNGSTSVSYTYNNGGTFTPAIQLKDATGCVTTFISPDVVYVDTLYLNLLATDTVLCSNECTQFTGTFSSGTPVSAMGWILPGGTPNAGVGPTIQSCYSVTGFWDASFYVTNATCTDTLTLANYIKSGDYPVASFTVVPDSGCSPLDVVFTNTSTSIDPIGVYEWDFQTDNIIDATAQDTAFTYTSPGTFTASLITTTVYGCADTATAVVTPTPAPPADAGPNTSICLGLNTTLQASGGATYVWSPAATLSDPLISNPVATPVVTTMYYVTVTGANGCTAVDSITVTVNSLPVANAGPNATVCDGFTTVLTATATAGTAPYTYAWPSGAGATVTVLPALPGQTYTVTVTDQNGCTDTDDVFVNVNANPTVTIVASPDSLCEGLATTLTATGSAAGNYLWSTGSTQFVISEVPPLVGNNTYTVTFTDLNGCSITGSQDVFVFILPNVGLTTDTPFICINDVAYLTATPQGAGFNYQWNPAASLDNPTSPTPGASPVVTTLYTVTITDANGCTGSASTIIEVSPFALPVIALSNDTTICINTFAQLFVSGGFNNNTAYNWEPSNIGLTCYNGCSNPFAQPLVTTTYCVSVEGLGGCIDTACVTVFVNDENIPLLPPDTIICQYDTVSVTLPAGVVSPLWSPADFLDCTICQTVNMFPDAATEYTVTATRNGCPLWDTMNVVVVYPESVYAGQDTFLCVGDSLTLNGTGVGTVTWTPNYNISDQNILNPTVSPDTTTTYVLTVVQGGCTLQDSIELLMFQQAEIDAVGASLCPGDTAMLSASGYVDRFEWSPTAGLSSDTASNPLVYATVTRDYYVTGYLGNCAADVDTVSVNVFVPVDVQDYKVYNFFPGESVVVSVPGFNDPLLYDYVWTPVDSFISCTNCPTPTVTSDDSRTYYVSVIDTNGCADTMQAILRVILTCEGNAVVIPNAFTPNADGLNDVLYVRSTAVTAINQFRVFNRWGQEVFYSQTMAEGWDGTYGGKNAEAGVYVWYLEFPCPLDGSPTILKGNVTLIR